MELRFSRILHAPSANSVGMHLHVNGKPCTMLDSLFRSRISRGFNSVPFNHPQHLIVFFVVLIASVAVSFDPVSAVAADEQLTESRYRQLHAELQPNKDALWRSIPWKITMLDAQAAAAKGNKPIFIWAMDGHPLGCT